MPEEYRVEGLEYRDLRWQCDCSEERLEKVLMTIGEKDLSQIIEEDRPKWYASSAAKNISLIKSTWKEFWQG